MQCAGDDVQAGRVSVLNEQWQFRMIRFLSFVYVTLESTTKNKRSGYRSSIVASARTYWGSWGLCFVWSNSTSPPWGFTDTARIPMCSFSRKWYFRMLILANESLLLSALCCWAIILQLWSLYKGSTVEEWLLVTARPQHATKIRDGMLFSCGRRTFTNAWHVGEDIWTFAFWFSGQNPVAYSFQSVFVCKAWRRGLAAKETVDALVSVSFSLSHLIDERRHRKIFLCLLYCSLRNL